jgi:hypothetical protein
MPPKNVALVVHVIEFVCKHLGSWLQSLFLLVTVRHSLKGLKAYDCCGHPRVVVML